MDSEGSPELPPTPASSVPATPVLPTVAAAPETSSVARATFYWLRDLAMSVVMALVVIVIFYQPVKVEGTSMMPSLVDQERIFINKFVYRFGLADIGRGDTVVF